MVRAGLATASADISDGLAADAGHIAEASGLRAVIDSASVPFSPACQAAIAAGPAWLERLITGGDDYELVFTAPPRAAASLMQAAAEAATPLTRIGHMEPGAGVVILGPDGSALPLKRTGYRHF